MPLPGSEYNLAIQPARYHVKLKNGKRFSISKYDPNVEAELKLASEHSVCIDERCSLCHSYGLALMPYPPVGETLIFTAGDYEQFRIEALVVVLEEFDPHDEDINSWEDIIKLGYGQQVYFTEFWSEDDV